MGPLPGLLLHAALDELPSLFMEPLRKDHIVSEDEAQLIRVPNLEGVLPEQELVHYDPDGPDVHALVVLFPFEHLGRQVERSTTEGRAQLVFPGLYTPTEVAYLGHTLGQ